MGRWQVVWLGVVAALGLVALGCGLSVHRAADEDGGAGQDATVDAGGLLSDGNDCTSAVCGASGCGAGPVSAGTPCSAGYCDGEGACLECLENAHCSDGNLCTADVCDAGTCHHATLNLCNDGNPCTANWYDETLGCQSTTVACDDANECTADVCDPALGCGHTALEDGTPCSYGQCQGGACVDTTGPTAKRVFRLDSLVLADPHVVFDKVLSTSSGTCRLCQDITHEDKTHTCVFPFAIPSSFDLPGLNPQYRVAIEQDNNGDGYFDLSFVITTDPHVQSGGDGGRLRVTEGHCSTGASACEPDSVATTRSTSYVNRSSGACLEPLPGTLGPLTRVAPNIPTGPCFVTGASEIILPLILDLERSKVINIRLRSIALAGKWTGDPAHAVEEGLLRGFLRMRDADAQHYGSVNLGRDLLPDNGSAHGCGCVWRAFPGGGTVGANRHALGADLQSGCPNDPGDSRDLFNPDADASYDNCGWWFYLNFTGTFVEDAEGF
jgi:hypothetical protein